MYETKKVKLSITVNETIIYELVENITHDKIRTSVVEIEKKLMSESVNPETVKGIFEVSVEMLQNVMNYSYHKDFAEYVDGCFMICFNSKEDTFTIKTINKITVDRKETIENRLAELKGLESKDLRKLMREKMRSRETVHKNGAGLGFIMIAKKSNNSMDASFDDFSDNICNFTLQVKI